MKHGEAINLNFFTRKDAPKREEAILKAGYVLLNKKDFSPLDLEKNSNSIKKIVYDPVLKRKEIVESFNSLEVSVAKKGLPTKEEYFNPSGFHLELSGNWAYLIGGKNDKEAEEELSRIEKNILASLKN